MENLLTSLNIEQLTTAGGFIAYLLWRVWTLEKQCAKWQDKYISLLVESQKDSAQQSATYERVLNALQGSS